MSIFQSIRRQSRHSSPRTLPLAALFSRREGASLNFSALELSDFNVTRAVRNPRAAWIFCALAGLGFCTRAFPMGLSFAGVPLTPPATVRANVALSDLEKSYVSEGGNVVPFHAVAVLAVPRGFDPKKTWPVLVVFSPAITNIRIVMTLRAFTSPARSRQAGCCSRAMGRSQLDRTAPAGAPVTRWRRWMR